MLKNIKKHKLLLLLFLKIHSSLCWKMKIWMRKSDFELESFFPHFNNSRLLLSFRSQPTDRSQTCQTIAYEEHCGQKKEKKERKRKKIGTDNSHKNMYMAQRQRQ